MGSASRRGRGEEDGDEGSGTNRTVGYVTAMFGVFNEPLSSCSLATELLLLAREVQHKHIKMTLLVQNISPIHGQRHEICSEPLFLSCILSNVNTRFGVHVFILQNLNCD